MSTQTQGFGLDAWMQAVRQMLAGAHLPPAPAPGFPGLDAWFAKPAWPGFGPMPGMAGAMPGVMPAMAQVTGFPGGLDAGPFTAFMAQLGHLAQGQWQELVTKLGGAGGAAMPPDWRSLLEALAASSGIGAGLNAGPDLAALRDALSTPQVGPMREHAERWQHALLAQLDHQEASRAFSAQLQEILKLGLNHFERRLAARAEAGKQAASMREVFDEWIEAGEQAWAERASSDTFVAALGRYTNTQVKVRAALFDQVNRIAESFGLPTRTEVERDHRRIAELERESRRLRRELDELRQARAVAPAKASERVEAGIVAPRAVTATRPTRRPVAARSAPRKASTKPTAAARTIPAASVVKAVAKPAATSRPAARKGTGTMFPVVAAPKAIGAVGGKHGSKAATTRRSAK